MMPRFWNACVGGCWAGGGELLLLLGAGLLRAGAGDALLLVAVRRGPWRGDSSGRAA